MGQLKRNNSCGLEIELDLDELRKELASDGHILPHSVLSTVQISMLSTQKPRSAAQLEKTIGELETENYESRIIERFMSIDLKQQANNSTGEGLGVEGRSSKRLRKNLVLIESSGDEG